MAIIDRVEERSHETILFARGEIDMSSSGELRSRLLALTRKRTPRIVVDMGAVSYIDSSGLATLIEGKKTATVYGGQVTLANVRQQVRAVFELAHLTDYFSMD